MKIIFIFLIILFIFLIICINIIKFKNKNEMFIANNSKDPSFVDGKMDFKYLTDKNYTQKILNKYYLNDDLRYYTYRYINHPYQNYNPYMFYVSRGNYENKNYYGSFANNIGRIWSFSPLETSKDLYKNYGIRY